MKKILFNTKYGLEQAILEGRKTMTRRLVGKNAIEDYHRYLEEGRELQLSIEPFDGFIRQYASYSVGEIVAIAQSYKTIRDEYLDNKDFAKADTLEMGFGRSKGWNNKMFVAAGEMKHHIKITNVCVEQLQDISDEDCLQEGIYPIKSEDVPQINETGVIYYTFGGVTGIWTTPRKAFAALIDKTCGNGTWESNPWCFCYSFELVD